MSLGGSCCVVREVLGAMRAVCSTCKGREEEAEKAGGEPGQSVQGIDPKLRSLLCKVQELSKF